MTTLATAGRTPTLNLNGTEGGYLKVKSHAKGSILAMVTLVVAMHLTEIAHRAASNKTTNKVNKK